MGARLQSKVALISGGARGQGAAHGELFAIEGAKVVLGDLLDELGEEHAAKLRANGHEVLYTHLDVTCYADWETAVELVEREFGLLNVLINNAGIVSLSAAAECPDDEWQRVIDVNQTGVFYGIRAAIPAMRRAGGGSIVNISSVYGIAGAEGYFAYQASKGAVLLMTKSTALTYGREGIRVNSVCPGLIYTTMTIEEGEENIRPVLEATPLGRGAEPIEVSHGVLYLASDESSFVTGTELVIDGGYLAR